MLKNRNRHDDLRMAHTDFESIAIILIELSLSGEPACFQSLQSCPPLSGEPVLKSIRMTL